MFALAAGLLWRHVHVWKSVKTSNLAPGDIEFFRRQFRRRTWTTCMMGAVGVCLGVGPYITNKIAVLSFWFGVTLLVFWIAFSALLDLLKTRSFLEETRRNQFKERSKLDAEIRNLRSSDRNGDK